METSNLTLLCGLSWIGLIVGSTILYLWWRQSHYDRFKDCRVERHNIWDEQQPADPAIADSRIAAWAQLKPLHVRAKQSQTTYHRFMALGVSSVFWGFIALAASITVLKHHAALPKILAAIDVLCFAAAFAFGFVARWQNRLWLKARLRAEVMRQWLALDDLLLGSVPTKSLNHLFTEALNSCPPLSAPELKEHWQDHKDRLHTKLEKLGGILAAERLNYYMQARPLRQLNWFYRSRRRLEDLNEKREATLLVLFLLAMAFASLKALGAWKILAPELYDFKDWFAFLLLLAIGCSAWITGLYLNQNARSLSHQYEIQEDLVADWLDEAERLFSAPVNDDDRSKSKEILNHIMKFEDLMFREFIDWTIVTSKDRAEVAA